MCQELGLEQIPSAKKAPSSSITPATYSMLVSNFSDFLYTFNMQQLSGACKYGPRRRTVQWQQHLAQTHLSATSQPFNGLLMPLTTT